MNEQKTEIPEWQVAIIDGEPELVVNAAAVRALLPICPVGPVEGRRRLIAAGFPEHLLDDPDGDA